MSVDERGADRLGRHFPPSSTSAPPADAPSGSAVSAAIRRTRDWLLNEQHPDGHWCGELEGDTILETEYVLLLTWLGRETDDVVVAAANRVREQQLPEGGWAIYPGGPLEISASVKAYWTLKIVGDDPAAEHMVRARESILAAGGAERVNSFTRYYFALLGVIDYAKCPAVPPELVLVPKWLPFNVYEMSAWSRTILVPLSLLWHFKPCRRLPEELGIRELFIESPESLPVCMPPSEVVDVPDRTWVDWRRVFGTADRCYKLLERSRFNPLRGMAVRRATKWMIDRLEGSDGLGAIFPPIIWTVVALRCLGHDEDSEIVRSQLGELERLVIREGDTVRLQPCKSPVWDTAIATLALREAGVSWNDPAIRRSVDWLLEKEVRVPGDWSVRNAGHEPAGWFFEYENQFYPDVDDTCMVVMALAQCLPDDSAEPWSAEFFLQDGWSPHPEDAKTAAVVTARAETTSDALRSIDTIAPRLNAIRRGVRWIIAMQNRDGGWGAFDRNNDRELYTYVPFADHNAMIDPSTADLTARMLEMFGRIGVDPRHPVVQPCVDRALDFVWQDQDEDGAWFGRWGVNYLYGTWQALVGLNRIGVPSHHPRLREAVRWLESVQQSHGGWGESPASYDDPTLRGRGPATPSQTAWALMGLMANGGVDSEAVRRGVRYLVETQNADGTWDEPWWTGTGFPRVFYLKYHLYRIYWPLMALARFERLGGRVELDESGGIDHASFA